MNKTQIVHRIESFFPNAVVNAYRVSKRSLKLRSKILAYELREARLRVTKNKISRRLKRGDRIRVAFMGFSSAPSVDVFKYFEKDDRFDCYAVIVPYTHDEKDLMIARYQRTRSYLEAQNIKILDGYDVSSDRIIDYSHKFGVVFFEIEYDWIDSHFKVSNFKDAYTYFIPYSPYLADNMEHHFSHKMLRDVHRIFFTNRAEYPMLKKYSQINGLNLCEEYLGYPKWDRFYTNNPPLIDVWKKAKPSQKRIIWAPHHTWVNYSNFIEYSEFMLRFALERKEEYCFVFKPHPALFESLRCINGWSLEEIKAYYQSWKDGENTDLCDGSWMDLFYYSDALILDSISFMLEYSLTGKPACVLYREAEDGGKVMPFNERGEFMYDLLYHAKNEAEVKNFLRMITVNEDIRKTERCNHIKSNCTPPYNKPAAQNIYEYVIRDLNL